MTVVIGVDGAGRTYRLNQIADSASAVIRLDASTVSSTETGKLLETARIDDCLLVVDDAHRLPSDVLRALTGAARQGVRIALARQPTLDRSELAELDEVVAASGSLEVLQPLTAEQLIDLLVAAGHEDPTDDAAEELFRASAGLPAIASALAHAQPGQPAPVLIARVQRRLALLDAATVRLA